MRRALPAERRCHELSAPRIIDGPITRSAFATYIETQLAPMLRKGEVVIVDNLDARMSEKAVACLQK
ncbi:hypothetical protein [Microvirga lotononidis]|uniref:hypothetical protein n=1 Tax=Microvirga lotononidis TaxID=864069 RepID=UPI0002DF8385|nr:hypothetical protein [Microvirga lotononidis]WQO31868.1 hypothetical protein U0023_31475 [Microvirga lotononidis]